MMRLDRSVWRLSLAFVAFSLAGCIPPNGGKGTLNATNPDADDGSFYRDNSDELGASSHAGSGSGAQQSSGGGPKGPPSKVVSAGEVPGLNYPAAKQYADRLPQKPEFAEAIRNGNPLCLRGVRKTLNVLFGRPLDAPLGATGTTFACATNERTLNTGGLGASSGKGVRYERRTVDLERGQLPEGSVIICQRLNGACGEGAAGHAEMYLGGRFVSGANDSPYSLCSRGRGTRYGRIDVYVPVKN